jgi:hypothetical protein
MTVSADEKMSKAAISSHYVAYHGAAAGEAGGVGMRSASEHGN